MPSSTSKKRKEKESEITRRGWDKLCDPPQGVGLLMIQEFYSNLWTTDAEAEKETPNCKIFVRGKVNHFSPPHIHKILCLRAPSSSSEAPSYEGRVKTNPRLVDVITNIREPNTDWKYDAEGRPNQLRRSDLIPMTREWFEFIQKSLIPSSNNFEVTVERAILVHSIMQGEEVRVDKLISKGIYHIAESRASTTYLGFPSLIYRLCKAAKVVIGQDVPIPVERPITEASTRKVLRRSPHRQAQVQEEEQVPQPLPPSPPALSPQPQGRAYQAEPSQYSSPLSPTVNLEQLYVEFQGFQLDMLDITSYLCAFIVQVHPNVPSFERCHREFARQRTEPANRRAWDTIVVRQTHQ
ncbi:hypothetical protein AHAS_Ahas12G0136200 [Arachis hypogaea]